MSSLNCAKDMFLTFIGNDAIINSFRTIRVKVIYIQKWVRNKLETRFSKVEVLVNYWDKLLGKTMKKAIRMSDT